VERKRNQVVEVNWLAYFEGIQSVCPWSLPAFRAGYIDIVSWRGYRIVLDRPMIARVYICKLNQRRLKKLASDFENLDQENEWLWSHPDFKNFSTPVPCLIQQNRIHLARIRKKQ